MKTFKQLLEDLSLFEATKKFSDIASELSTGDLSSFVGKTGQHKKVGGLMTSNAQAHLASIRNDPNPKHPHVKEFLTAHHSNPSHPDFQTHYNDHKGITKSGGQERKPEEMRGFKKSQEAYTKPEEPKVDHTAEHAAKESAAKDKAEKMNKKLAQVTTATTATPEDKKPADKKTKGKTLGAVRSAAGGGVHKQSDATFTPEQQAARSAQRKLDARNS